MKRTKIVATLGPATDDYKQIRKLVDLGVNVFRLNFSHGTREEHVKRIKLIRKIEKEIGSPIAILQDLQGPRIRVGIVKSGSIVLKKDALVKLVPKAKEGEIPLEKKVISILNRGNRILLDDGNLELTVVSKDDSSVTAKVSVGGILTSNKGINLPDVDLNIPALSSKDIEDVKVAVNAGIDYIALSFVKSEKDVKDLKKLIRSRKKEVKVISKIERHEAIRNIEEIVNESDGIMIARGDLGIELSLEKVPLIQKEIVEKCVYVGKPVIIATQILDSMITKHRATRAEISDITNAIIDGADALMLSGETATGSYPLRTIQTMNKTAVKAENWSFQRKLFNNKARGIFSINDGIGKSAAKLSEELGVKVIINATASGKTTKSLSKFRPKAPIVSLTHTDKVARELELVWGVYAFKSKFNSIRDMVKRGTEFSKKLGILKKGDLILVISGERVGLQGGTNMVKVVYAK